MRIEIFRVGPLQTNMYFLILDGELMIVDPGGSPEQIISLIEKRRLKPVAIIATHGHFDHTAGVGVLSKQYKIPFFMHPGDSDILNNMQNVSAMYGVPFFGLPEQVSWLRDDEPVCAGSFTLNWRHVPGHSPGSILIFTNGPVLCGDTIFRRSAGRTDFPGGDSDALSRSIRNEIYTLPEKTQLMPGHGEPTTVGEEKLENPFVRP